MKYHLTSSSIPRLGAAIICILLGGSLLTACSSDASGAPAAASDDAEVPSFVGAYADEYRQTWQNAEIDFVRDVIRDEEITEQEWAEVLKRFGDCFQKKGVTLLEYEGGAYGVEPGPGVSEERLQDIMTQCETESGETPLGRLWFGQRSNPDNRDANEIMRECLIRIGALDPSYSLEEYLRDNPRFAFPFLAKNGPELYDKCSSAPLTATADE